MTVQTNTHWKWLHIVSTGATGNSLGTPIGSANSQLHQRFTVDTEGTRERARYHWKALDARFSDHLSDHQIDFRPVLVLVRNGQQKQNLSVWKFVKVLVQFAFTTSLEMKLLWLSKWSPIGVNLVSMDRRHIGLHYDRRDLKFNESSRVSLLEPSRSILRFLSFFQNPWQRDSETSGLAMLLVRACGAETFVPWTLLERAGASCVFMLELNFRSGSSITQMRLTSRSDCYRAGALGVLFLSFSDLRILCFYRYFRDLLCYLDLCFVCRVRRLSACGYVMLLPPPKLQAIAPRVFVIGDYVRHGYFVNSWGSLLDWVRQLALCHIGVTLVMLGGPIGSETRQR
uniref:Uncharacterized protein n=1 Tax=Brassica oleracea var. oleracea TaxID=109376 RepID=A0A0D3CBB9_BRAOL